MGVNNQNLVADFLKSLRIPFTRDYTNQRFESMTFKTLFGVSSLLKEYGIESEGFSISDKREISKIPTPFIAHTRKGSVVVSKIEGNLLSYITEGVVEKIPLKESADSWTGEVLCARKLPGAKEPDYGDHVRLDVIKNIKYALVWILAGVLLAYLLITNGLWRYWSVWALIAVDICGLSLTYMLVQKSLNIKNDVADKVCGVLQEGGCDKILKTSASSFFGIFSWSEVGFTYFGVSLLAMLIAPVTLHWLAIINICCLPFTVWSLWYQKFKAKHWCTLCVSVQLSLWLQFICYFFGRWEVPVFPLRLGFFALVATFVMVLLLLNRLLPHFTNNNI